MLIAKPRTKRFEPVALPRIGRWLLRGFRRYCLRYVRKHFHALRLSRSSHPLPPGNEPILMVLNHPSWWDPLIAAVLCEKFHELSNRDDLVSRATSMAGLFDHYAAIDAVAAARYAFLQRLGFIGIDTKSLRGAAAFLRIGQSVLAEPGRTFWVTAQGRFTDVRERPLNLRSGVGHLAARMERGFVVPLALEYAFWNERTPEALVRLGEPIAIAEHPGLNGREWTQRIEDNLTEALDGLNAESMSRDAVKFETLLAGRTGVGGLYDGWRRIMAWLRGR
ncbi:MAG TPA: lysophospholipid acyltransferase family protein, partial [Urbifossiella sp.]